MATIAGGGPPTNDDTVFFITLPNELITEVASYLDPSDLLKLRCILPKTYNELLEKLLQDVKSRLYLEAGATSLENFKHICKSPYFRNDVREVVFIPKILGGTDEDQELYDVTEYAGQCKAEARACKVPKSVATSHTFVKRSWEIYRSAVQEHRPVIEVAMGCNGAESSANFIRTVKSSLRRLPNLARVSVLRTITEPGLNSSSFWYTNEYASGRVDSRPHSRSTDDAARMANMFAGWMVSEHGVEGFLHGLRKSGVNIPELRLGDDGEAQLSFNLQEFEFDDCHALSSVAPALTKLTISCENSDDDDWLVGTNTQWRPLSLIHI